MALLKSAKPRRGTGEGETPAVNQLNSKEIDYYASREAGQINYDLILLDQIDMDPTNPRTQGINASHLLTLVPKFLVIDPNHENYDGAAVLDFDQTMDSAIAGLVRNNPLSTTSLEKFFYRLKALAVNIRLLGVKQPIELNRVGRRYQIVYGHRRYLASIIAGERTIPARVMSKNEPRKKHVQASENLHQEELNLAQRLDAIKGAIDELDIDLSHINVSATANLLGFERTLLGRYIDILRHGSPSLREAIRAGLVNNIHDGVKLAKLSDSACVTAMETLNQPATHQATTSVGTLTASTRGAKRKYITTPKILDTAVVKSIVHQCDWPVNDINWDNKSEVNQLWKAFIEAQHQACRKDG